MNLIRDIDRWLPGFMDIHVIRDTDRWMPRCMDVILETHVETGRSMDLMRLTDRCTNKQIHRFDKRYRQTDAETDRSMDLITDTGGWTDRQIITFDKRHRQTDVGTDRWIYGYLNRTCYGHFMEKNE